MTSLYPQQKVSPEISACKSIIRNLFSKRYKHLAWVFYEPIDADLLGLEDYNNTIMEPMDLSTIRRRLNSAFYKNPVDFARDVLLIFYNTYLYTKPGHLCYDMAKKLQLIFEQMYKRLVGEAQAPNNAVYVDSDSSIDAQLEEDEASSSSDTLEPYQESRVAQILDSTSLPKMPLPLQEAAATDASLLLPLSCDEDLELHIRMQQLDDITLLNVIHMIRQLEGLSFAYPSNELEFDVHSLKTHTKRSILAFMASKGVTGKRVPRLKKFV
ncbi:CG30417 [Drosophila busckii]|uniref:CG30417 n=1 Tax=Drosophila busckii TaxID=30019 RepID=A0A0M4ECB6_DROBS|nr:bromodomain testis-specific protein [Drosophila busckii]ALC41340.1 CG30417 [Drosophila busckii]